MRAPRARRRSDGRTAKPVVGTRATTGVDTPPAGRRPSRGIATATRGSAARSAAPCRPRPGDREEERMRTFTGTRVHTAAHDSPLHGRVAVVTGAARGVGEALARRLSAEGMRIALLGREEKTLHRAAAALTSPSI